MTRSVCWHALHDALGFTEPCELIVPSASPFEWKMETHDAPMLRYLLRQLRPRRHLEFGTHQGFGTVLVCEETDATVWTINTWEGETLPNGQPAYAMRVDHVPADLAPMNAIRCNDPHAPAGQQEYFYIQTDALTMIGHLYRERGFGHRVCQIYGDSRLWDTRHYPDGFFDTVLIDGSHRADVVASDTTKAVRLTRPGGAILWHDYHPSPEVRSRSEAARGVWEALERLRPALNRVLSDLIWIDPGFLAIGITRGPDAWIDTSLPNREA